MSDMRECPFCNKTWFVESKKDWNVSDPAKRLFGDKKKTVTMWQPLFVMNCRDGKKAYYDGYWNFEKKQAVENSDTLYGWIKHEVELV